MGRGLRRSTKSKIDETGHGILIKTLAGLSGVHLCWPTQRSGTANINRKKTSSVY
jgi:hypothetical protein